MRERASRRNRGNVRATPRRPFQPKQRAGARDVEVGRRVRAIRLERDMSQSALGKLLGVTFQQVQKYEKGVNRIGAGRLQALAEIFDVPISAFFDEKKEAGDHKGTLFELADSAGALSLLRAYSSLPDQRLKRALVQLATTMSARYGDGAED
jgi:transcriptional regulator with XRE-family HTH domain